MGVTSYWTDADGNVVFGPNTPKEKMKTPGSTSKTQKQKGDRTKIKILVTSKLKCLLMIVRLQNLQQGLFRCNKLMKTSYTCRTVWRRFLLTLLGSQKPQILFKEMMKTGECCPAINF